MELVLGTAMVVGYVPTAEQLEEGGYEAVESAYHFGPAVLFRFIHQIEY